MYYACAIKDVEQRRRSKEKRVLRSVMKVVKKTTISGNTVDGGKESNEERNIEADEKTVEKIRETAERLIQHDTQGIFADLNSLKEDTEKKEEMDDNIKGHSETKGKIKKELVKIKKETSIEKGEKRKNEEEKRVIKVGHNKMLTQKNTKKTADKSKNIKKKLKTKEKKEDKTSESRLKLISSKYHEMEKVLLELKNMIELEEDRLAGTSKSANELHAAHEVEAGNHEEDSLKESNGAEDDIKRKPEAHEPHKNKETHTKKGSKKNNSDDNKIINIKDHQSTKKESTKNEIIKEGDLTKHIAEKEKKHLSSHQQNESYSERNTFFQRCKLAAYLYFIAVRGFGDKFYLEEVPEWCEKGCVKANAGPHVKKLRRPRAIP